MKNTIEMQSLTVDLKDIDRTSLDLVGGKGANLGELSSVEGIQVPPGFCISTEAYKKIIGETSPVNELLDQLLRLQLKDSNKIAQLSAEICSVVEAIPIPQELIEDISYNLSKAGENYAYAIRSSATAEDLPTTSFAGQQDSYLNIIGKEAILKHISKCWASLFTERAIIYRMQNGFDHRKVFLAVIVQKMIFPQTAGIMFTADPVTANRKVISIDASPGLGEALVAGLVNADLYKICNGTIIDKQISSKKLAIHAVAKGGTTIQEIATEQQNKPALTDKQILTLARLGKTIEAHFGNPQDIEWCLADDEFYIVQSRPITTLFPIPQTTDAENHVYVSVGHQQMMTDAMKPLGLSFFLLLSNGSMREAGGRLFVDITQMLASPEGRQRLMNTLAKSDPLIKDALLTVMDRDGFIKQVPDEPATAATNKRPAGIPTPSSHPAIENDPKIAADLINRSRASIERLKTNIQTKSGSAVFDFILDDIKEQKTVIWDAMNIAAIMAGINASFWINDKMKEWLGEVNPADTLAQSVPNNITSEMGLALLDVADVIRPYPRIIEYLQQVKDDAFLDDLIKFEGGQETRDAISDYLNKYGMRCSGEIDITRTRWMEKPAIIVPMILNNIRNFDPNAGPLKFEQGRQEALQKEQDLLARLALLPDGEQKARETKEKIDLLRNFSGYREYPKYGMVSRHLAYKQALLKEAAQLVKANIIAEKEDIFYLYFEELQEVVRTKTVDAAMISRRKEEFKGYEKMSAPRMVTSDGEIITSTYKREHLPANAIVGLAVSTGLVEGRARVIINMEDADLEDGDILITRFTDPSWTPLFVSIKGLVTEVGGLMTHGSVIAREYGLPAVVGVANATTLIKDGQRIRVNGTDGYVEKL